MSEDAQRPGSVAPDAPDAEPDGASPTRLATSQVRRLRRIVDAASRLAEEGGFENVRLRDVAEASGVALGTLYRYFRSKEDILVFVLAEQVDALERALTRRPPEGATAAERAGVVFGMTTRALTARPHLARALLRAVSAGEPETKEKVASFHLRVSRIVLDVLRGEAEATDELEAAANILQQVWFASLVGWTGGLHDADMVVRQVEDAAALLLD